MRLPTPDVTTSIPKVLPRRAIQAEGRLFSLPLRRAPLHVRVYAFSCVLDCHVADYCFGSVSYKHFPPPSPSACRTCVYRVLTATGDLALILCDN
jgi:hypothetical protein